MSFTKVYRFEMLRSNAVLALNAEVEEARAQLVKAEQKLEDLERDLAYWEARRKKASSKVLKVLIAGHLENATALQARASDEATRSRLALETLELTKEDRTELAPVDYLIGPGLGLHGTFYYAYVSVGASGGVETSFSPVGVLGVNFKISGSLSAGSAKQRSIVIYRAPTFVTEGAAAPRNPVSNPLQINSLVGKNWQFTVKGGLELSVGWEFRASVTAKNEDGTIRCEPDTTDESTTERDQKMREERATELELAGIGFEVKTGLQADRTYRYENFYAEDLFPLRYGVEDFDQTLRRDFAQILQEGSTKTMLKARACELMRQNPKLFPDENVNLHETHFGGWVTTQSSEKVAAAIWRHTNPENFLVATNADRKELRKAVDLARALDLYAPPSELAAKTRAYGFILRWGLDELDNGTVYVLKLKKTPEKTPARTLDGILKAQAPTIAKYVHELMLAKGRSAATAKAMSEGAHGDLLHYRRLLQPYLVDEKTLETTLAILKRHSEPSWSYAGCKVQPKRPPRFCCHAPLPAANPVAVLDYLNRVTNSWCCDEVRDRLALHGVVEPEETLVFLNITSDEHSGGGGGFASALVEGQAIAASGTLGAKATLGYVKVEKTSHCRFQTASTLSNADPAGETPTVLTSFESVITYSQERVGPTLEIEAALKVLHKELNIDQIERVKKTKERLEGFLTERSWTLNAMHYQTTVASWQKPSNSTTTAKGSTTLLAGSGVSIGAPFVLDSLRSLYVLAANEADSFEHQCMYEAYAAGEGGSKWRDTMKASLDRHKQSKPKLKVAPTARHRYFQNIANRLKLASGLPKDAQYPVSFVAATFFFNKEVRERIMDLTDPGLRESGALFLEATYRLTAPLTVGWVCTSDENRPNRKVVTLDALASRQILDAPRALESMRLRYRKCDHVIKDREAFSLGFSLGGTGVGVKIASIDRAGYEGVSDLVTAFPRYKPLYCDWEFAPDDVAQKTERFDTAVPPSPLFCQ